MQKTLNVSISPAGTVVIDAVGFTGCGCAKASEELELHLGGGQVKKDKKPEYFQPEVSGSNHNKRTF